MSCRCASQGRQHPDEAPPHYHWICRRHFWPRKCLIFAYHGFCSNCSCQATMKSHAPWTSDPMCAAQAKGLLLSGKTWQVGNRRFTKKFVGAPHAARPKYCELTWTQLRPSFLHVSGTTNWHVQTFKGSGIKLTVQSLPAVDAHVCKSHCLCDLHQFARVRGEAWSFHVYARIVQSLSWLSP